jgi:2-keto-3-deoxy-L-fuconate dehydrogenase
MYMFSLQDKTAVVTGGGSGIGRAIAELFAQQGAAVIVVDLDEKSGQETVAAIQAAGGKAQFRSCNVAHQDDVRAVFSSLDRLDILVNNAGVAHVGTVESTTEADMDRIIAVNVKGVYNCLHAGVPLLRQSGGGAILNMASIVASVGIPDRFAYSMSKGAVAAMTLSVAKDYVGQKIRCNCISPARVHTPFVDGFLAKNYPGNEAEMFEKLSKTQPIGRMGQPSEIAALALYLCSDEAGFVTGCDFPIDGGFIKLNN